jgi:hypothetical protein
VNYKVLIPLSIKQEIARLPGNLPIEVLKKIHQEFAANPNQYLGPAVFPYALRPYQFTLTDAQGVNHWFVFQIDGLDPASKPVLRVFSFKHTII